MTKDELGNLLNEATSISDIDSLAPDQPLMDQGIDSLDFAALLLLVEERYGVVVPDSRVDECSTISGLLAFANTLGD